MAPVSLVEVGAAVERAGELFRRRSRVETSAGGIASSVAAIATAIPAFVQKTAPRLGVGLERAEQAQRVDLVRFISVPPIGGCTVITVTLDGVVGLRTPISREFLGEADRSTVTSLARELAVERGVSERTVWRWIKEARLAGTWPARPSHCHGCGAPFAEPVTTRRRYCGSSCRVAAFRARTSGRPVPRRGSRTRPASGASA